MKIEEILSRNLDALMSAHEELNSQQKLSRKTGVGQTSVGRMRRADGSATIDNVHSVARAFGLTAYELLDPHLTDRLRLSPSMLTKIERITQKLRSGKLDERQIKVIEATLEIE